MKRVINLDLKMCILRQYTNQLLFAAAVSKSESYVSHVIRGARRLPPNEYSVWANALGMTESDFEGIMGTDTPVGSNI